MWFNVYEMQLHILHKEIWRKQFFWCSSSSSCITFPAYAYSLGLCLSPWSQSKPMCTELTPRIRFHLDREAQVAWMLIITLHFASLVLVQTFACIPVNRVGPIHIFTPFPLKHHQNDRIGILNGVNSLVQREWKRRQQWMEDSTNF